MELHSSVMQKVILELSDRLWFEAVVGVIHALVRCDVLERKLRQSFRLDQKLAASSLNFLKL